MSVPVETVIVPLLAEEMTVARRRIDTARVRVRVQAVTRPVEVDEMLHDERIEVTRVPVGRRVDAIPAVFERDGVTVIPVVEEVLVVERRLVLREEVHVRRVRIERMYHETVILRHQEATVEREPIQTEPYPADHVHEASRTMEISDG